MEVRRRRRDGEQGPIALRISRAAPELTTGRRVTGDPKSEAGHRIVVLPAFLAVDVRRHLDWFAAKEPDGLLFVGERGAPFCRSTFGRKGRKAREKVAGCRTTSASTTFATPAITSRPTPVPR
jgi:hypothetical protein